MACTSGRRKGWDSRKWDNTNALAAASTIIEPDISGHLSLNAQHTVAKNILLTYENPPLPVRSQPEALRRGICAGVSVHAAGGACARPARHAPEGHIFRRRKRIREVDTARGHRRPEGFNAEGGSRTPLRTRAAHRGCPSISACRHPRARRFFLRAESFFNVTTAI